MIGDLQRSAFTSEYIAKFFSERFKAARAAFFSHINKANPTSLSTEHEQYFSLLINRLMFLYFLQKKDFLNGDKDYLLHQLQLSQKCTGLNSFFRTFLVPLFQTGLTAPADLNNASSFFGNIPCLGKQLFMCHAVKTQLAQLLIPDQAFEQLFAFFETFQWCLDSSSIQYKNSITPDVLGYIFEQYVNQQQMGAYYTREDVTDYVARNTIIPYLFDALGSAFPQTFCPGGGIWHLLRDKPDRYIHQAIRSTDMHTDETVQDYHQRLSYYANLRHDLTTGIITSIDAMITNNLDILQFACDIIHAIEDYDTVDAYYQQLQQMAILDPTCGSGAFLFAALRTLYPLYDACLERLQALAGNRPRHVSLVPTRRSTVIIATIMTHNLYGVDIMEEAVEICKLRLYLKLFSCTDHIHEELPLPGLNQHIYSGNALADIYPTTQFPAVQRKDGEQSQFSWYKTFSSIIDSGGFAVIIGNPPYVEYSERAFPYTLHDFITRSCANLYTCIIERSRGLLSSQGRQGMILPLAAFATKNMQPFLEAFERWFPVSWLSFYHFRPSMLFSGGKVASIPTAIYLAKPTGQEQRFSTCLLKWTQEQRAFLFSRLTYCQVTLPPDLHNRHYYPKFGNHLENAIMLKVRGHDLIQTYLSRSPNHNTMFYRSAGGLYWKIFVNFSWPYDTTSNKQCCFKEDYDRDIFVALFNSSLFWWYYTVTFDTFNLKDYMLFGFRFTYPQDSEILRALKMWNQQLMADFCKYAKHLRRGQTGSYTIYAKKSKPILDAIDRILARHYGFTEDELDFILNYDLKYRMGIEQLQDEIDA